MMLLAGGAAALIAGQQPLERAWSLAANGRPAEAIQLLHQIIGNDPSNGDARLLLGSLLMERGDKAGSIEQLTAAVHLRPRSEEAENALGETYKKFGDVAAARRAFERAVELKPDYGIAQSNLGQALFAAGDVAAAGKHLDRAVALLGRSDDAADAHYLLAKIYAGRDRTKEAAKQLEEAVEIRPKFAEAWSDLGQARKLLLDDSGALAAFQNAVAANPQDAVAQYRLGAEYLHQDKAHLAVEHLRKAFERTPADQSTLNALQTALRKDGDIEGANRARQQLTDMLAARDRSNQNKLAAVRLNNDGAVLEESGDLRGALAKYAEASRLDPDHSGIRVNYGVALLRLGQWTQGLEELHIALLRDPTNTQLKATLKDALAQAPSNTVPKWKDEIQ